MGHVTGEATTQRCKVPIGATGDRHGSAPAETTGGYCGRIRLAVGLFCVKVAPVRRPDRRRHRQLAQMNRLMSASTHS